MSDFSLFSLFTAGLACLVPLTNAYTKPVGAEPKGNPIWTPGLHDVVPVGQPYTITWEPTTEGTVTLVLLKGPETNAIPQYAIVEKTMNSGSYVWVPSEDLAPGETGYGIQLICDSNGQYQYTTQFGISNPDYQPGSYGSSASASASASAPASYGSGIMPSSGWAHPTGYAHGTGYAHPTGGWAHANHTQPKPTGYTKPKPTWHTTKAPTTETSYAPAPTSVQPQPSPTGGASTVAASLFGFVAAAGVAVFAL